MSGRYAHAKQFKRNERMVRFLRTRVGRLIRNIERKIGDDPALREAFAARLSRAERVRRQSASAAGSSIPARSTPPRSGVHWKGQGLGALRVRLQDLHRNPMRPGAARQSLRRPHPGSRLRRHRATHRRQGPCGQRLSRLQPSQPLPRLDHRITGQIRRVTTTIRREMRRRRAGDRPPQGRPPDAAELSQSHDRANVILAATGYNFRLSSAGSRRSCACPGPGTPQSRRHAPIRLKAQVLHGRRARRRPQLGHLDGG